MEEITIRDEDSGESYMLCGEPWGEPESGLFCWRIVSRKPEPDGEDESNGPER